jgi:hypothetical protein
LRRKWWGYFSIDCLPPGKRFPLRLPSSGLNRSHFNSILAPDGLSWSCWDSRGHSLGVKEIGRRADTSRALNEIRTYRPELLAISAGFDTYKGDPITAMRLEIETFGEIGRRIASLKLPTFAVLEGGYAPELGRRVAA